MTRGRTMRGMALALSVALSALPGAAWAQNTSLDALKAALPGRLINDPTRLDWAVFGPGQSSKSVKDASFPGGGALQITVPEAGATLYDVGTNAPITAPIKRGQTLVVSFYARTVSAETPSGRGKIGVRFQLNAAPYSGFGDTTLDIDTGWKLYEVTGKATTDIAMGAGVVGFQLAGAKQVIEIAQTIVVEGATSIVPKAAAAAAAPETPVIMPQLAAKGALLNDPSTQNWDIYGSGEVHKRVAARGTPGDSALQFTITAVAANPDGIGASMPITEPIASGDVIIIAFLARTVSADTPDALGKIGVRVQRNAPPFPGFGDHVLAIGPTWRLYQIKTQSNIAIPQGEGALGFHLAGAKQTVEIGRAYVIRAAAP